jgi:DNA-binding transcriptional LysR family regulator
LLREKNVTRAAEQLGVTQPAMSNILRRLRVLFNDPLLIRSSEGMTATERALELQPRIREVLGDLSQILEPRAEFRPLTSNRVFRIMASDYAEATLIPALVKAMRSEAPNVVLDFLRLAMCLIGIWSRVKSIWRLIALTKFLNRSIKY